MIQSIRKKLMDVVEKSREEHEEKKRRDGAKHPTLRKELGKKAHPGLLLQRMLVQQPEKNDKLKGDHPYADLVDAIGDWQIPEGYAKAFGRWLGLVESEPHVRLLEAVATGPLALGLGTASPIENGLTIHHTYGVPYIPGSALKGLARRAALASDLQSSEISVIFGTTEEAGHITFWDAWLEPAGGHRQPYQRDVLTPHHPNYYRTKGSAPPTDFDDPKPITFLSVRPNTRFVMAVSSSSEGAEPWVNLAAQLVKLGLERLGVGAKTAAGYGFFKCKPKPSAEQRKQVEAEVKALMEKYEGQIERIQNHSHLSLVDKLLRELSKENPLPRKAVLERLKGQLEEANMWDEQDGRIVKLKDLLGGSR